MVNSGPTGSAKAYKTRSTTLAAVIIANGGIFLNEEDGMTDKGLGKIITPDDRNGSVTWWFKPRTKDGRKVVDIVDGFNDLGHTERLMELLNRIEDKNLKREIEEVFPKASAGWMHVFAQNFARLRDIARRKPNSYVKVSSGRHTRLITKGASPGLLKRLRIQ